MYFLKFYRSESPSQIFIFTQYWLFEILSQIPTEKWSDDTLAYDNMCSLDSMKVAQKPLPMEPPYDQMWLSIQKVPICTCNYVSYIKVNTINIANL